MAVKTDQEEKSEGGQSTENPILRTLWSVYGADWLKFPQGNLIPLFLLTKEAKKKHDKGKRKDYFANKKKKTTGIGKKREKHFLWSRMYGYVPIILSGLQRFCLICLLPLMLLLQMVNALEEDCTLWGGKRNDATLDAFDVNEFLSESGIFNGTNMNYNKICPDAFAHAPVHCILLSGNNISGLPESLCNDLTNLERLNLQGTQLIEIPPALNYCNTVLFLNLADTKITDVPEQSIIGMTRLTVLDLSRTEITYVPQVIFNMPLLKLVDLSNTKLEFLPLPLPTCDSFNVTLSGDHDNELTILLTDSGRKMGINITEIDTLTCENAKAAVAKSYKVLAGEIVCDNGSFKKIDILLSGKFTSVPTYEPQENSKDTLGGDVPSKGTSSPRLYSYRNTAQLPFIISLIGLIAYFGPISV